MEPKRFQTFEDLECYNVAREFRKSMYAVTRRLPNFEKFELASQIRRAAASLTNNIAEGRAIPFLGSDQVYVPGTRLAGRADR